MNNPMQIRPPADAHAPSRFASPVQITPDVEVRFLSALREFGQVTYASNVCGMTRSALYARRKRDKEFAERWDDAVDHFEDTLTRRVIQTAIHMGTGRWVPALDPITDEPELDDDFEPVLRFDCSLVDPRIAIKLMALRMRDVNAAAAPAVQVNQQFNSYGDGRPEVVYDVLDLDALRAEPIEEQDHD